MPNYRRAFIPGGCWFFTVNLLERRETLLVDHIETLREAVSATRQKYPFTIDAIVVLPNHLHAVWTLSPADADFSMRWRLIKARFAKSLPKQERLSAGGKPAASGAYGSAASGNTSSATRSITLAMSSIATSTPSNTGLSVGCRTGRIRHFIATCDGEFFPRIGQEM
jgi:REP element-mobilizing transposase RayT